MLLTIPLSQDDPLRPVTAEEKMQLLTAKASSTWLSDIGQRHVIELVQQKNVEVEIKSNKLEQKRRHGSLVHYGSTVQVTYWLLIRLVDIDCAYSKLFEVQFGIM